MPPNMSDTEGLDHLLLWADFSVDNLTELGLCLNRWILRRGLAKTKSRNPRQKDSFVLRLRAAETHYVSDTMAYYLLGYGTTPVTRWSHASLKAALDYVGRSSTQILLELGVCEPQHFAEPPAEQAGVSVRSLALLDSFHHKPRTKLKFQRNRENLMAFGLFVRKTFFLRLGDQKRFVTRYAALRGLSVEESPAVRASSATVSFSRVLAGTGPCWDVDLLMELADFGGLTMEALLDTHDAWIAKQLPHATH